MSVLQIAWLLTKIVLAFGLLVCGVIAVFLVWVAALMVFALGAELWAQWTGQSHGQP